MFFAQPITAGSTACEPLINWPDPHHRVRAATEGLTRQRTNGLWVCSLSLLAWRFSLSDLPDFLEAVLRGDLSDMSAPFPYCDRTPFPIGSQRAKAWPRVTVRIAGSVRQACSLTTGLANPIHTRDSRLGDKPLARASHLMVGGIVVTPHRAVRP